ncbi:hypothetical protein K474DRAFT_617402 [Panus rudis PR-1116 ss-1]|nr:hypothetical protein K474DRAFT_617402 [Panus rudis PR-1116 ss-1]
MYSEHPCIRKLFNYRSGSPYVIIAGEHLDKLRLLNLIARAMTPILGADSPSPSQTDEIVKLLDLHCHLIVFQLRQDSRSNIIKRFKRSLRMIWLPAIERLRSFEPSLHTTNVLLHWTKLGRLVRLREDDEVTAYDDFLANQYRNFPRGNTKRCHFVHCLCFLDSHPTHTMKVCKGCRKAHYCSSQCQENDLSIHHDDCMRWRAKVNMLSLGICVAPECEDNFCVPRGSALRKKLG